MLHHRRLAPIITKGCKVRLFINLLFFYGSGALSLCTAFTFSAVYVTLLQFVAASKVNEIILKVFPTRDLYCNRRYMISCIKILSLKSLCWFRTNKSRQKVHRQLNTISRDSMSKYYKLQLIEGVHNGL